MFNHDSHSSIRKIEIILDGAPTMVPGDMNVAAALLAIGIITSRISPSSHKPCGAHCLMGVCFECLMEIDGVQRQACMTEVVEGMIINRNLKQGKGGE